MSKEEKIYFYSMFCVIMDLLQSNQLEVHKATVEALNKENLNIGDCYRVYTESMKNHS